MRKFYSYYVDTASLRRTLFYLGIFLCVSGCADETLDKEPVDWANGSHESGLSRLLPPASAYGPGIHKAWSTTDIENWVESELGKDGNNILIINDDTYNNVNFTVERSGTASNPIIIAAENFGKVTFTGTTSIVFHGDYIYIYGINIVNADRSIASSPNIIFAMGEKNGGYANYCIASHMTIDGCASNNDCPSINSDEFAPAKPFLATWGRGNRIMYSQFKNKSSRGEFIWAARKQEDIPDNTWLYRNHFYNRPFPGYDSKGGNINQFEAVRVADSGISGAIIEENLFEECGGENEIVTIKSDGVIFRNNTILDSSSDQATYVNLRATNNSFVSHNSFVDTNPGLNRPTAGISVFGSNHLIVNNYFEGLNESPVTINGGNNAYAPADNAVVSFNTIIDNSKALTHGSKAIHPVGAQIISNYFRNSGNVEAFKEANPSLGVAAQANNRVSSNTNAGDIEIGSNGNVQSSIATIDVHDIIRPLIRGGNYVGAFHPAFSASWITSDPTLQEAIGEPLGYMLTPADVGPNALIYSRPRVAPGSESLVNMTTSEWFYGTVNNQGTINFPVSIPYPGGKYRLSARVVAPNGSQDSFYVNAGDTSSEIWHIPNSSFAQNRTFAKPISLNSGYQTLSFDVRENYTYVNHLYLKPEKEIYGFPVIASGSSSVVQYSSGWVFGTNNTEGSIEFNVRIPEAGGEYRLSAGVYAPNGNQDSFYVTAGNISNEVWFLPNSSAPHIVTFPENVRLTGGNQTITFGIRENYTYVLYIVLH